LGKGRGGEVERREDADVQLQSDFAGADEPGREGAEAAPRVGSAGRAELNLGCEQVPTAKDFVDVVLSRTQRQTPTVVRKRFNISRIRQFYMRKVKHTQTVWNEKLSRLLSDFPKVDDIHPFYSDLLNVLYDKDHYKLALGQLSTARSLIDRVAKDYVKLLKYGDSLYRCKQLKRAALGRMAKTIRQQHASLAYLEQVRQHMSRLPSIDPNDRTVVVCGYPNVGKSSFMNNVTRADIDVQPYAFTTKSLFVGHSDYKYLRWQLIDTPGVLDRPLEDRNTIEMQSVTALAHLHAVVLFIVDVSEQCGYSIQQQVALFDSIKPLFVNKPLVAVLNKCDSKSPEDLPQEDIDAIQRMLSSAAATTSDETLQPEGEPLSSALRMSTRTSDGVVNVKEQCCEKLLARRVQSKLNTRRVNQVTNRLHVATPQQRDNRERQPVIPENVKERQEARQQGQRFRTERDLEEEQGGPGVYTSDARAQYDLERSEWRYDIMPEVMDGHNVQDFFDPEVEQRLQELEQEEMERTKTEEEPPEPSGEEHLTAEERSMLEQIRQKRSRMHEESKRRRGMGNSRPRMPRVASRGNKKLTENKMRSHLSSLGLDPEQAVQRATAKSKAREERDQQQQVQLERKIDGGGRKKRKALEQPKDVEMDQGGKEISKRMAPRAKAAAVSKKPGDGFKDAVQKVKAHRLSEQKAAKTWAKDGRRGEGDQKHYNKMPPMHLMRGAHSPHKHQHR
jgi:nucleolar GTP-binding protein